MCRLRTMPPEHHGRYACQPRQGPANRAKDSPNVCTCRPTSMPERIESGQVSPPGQDERRGVAEPEPKPRGTEQVHCKMRHGSSGVSWSVRQSQPVAPTDGMPLQPVNYVGRAELTE